MSQKRKVVLIVHALNVGGMERVVSVLINQFNNFNQFELHLILLKKQNEIFYDLPANIHIYRPLFDFVGNRTIYTLKVIFYLRKQLSKINADAIISFGELWNNLVLIAALGKNYPIYISDRSQPGKRLSSLQEFLRKRLYPTSKGIIAQTEVAKYELEKKIKHNNIQVIGNPFDLIENRNGVRKEKIILSVGRLIKTKHHDALIKSFVNLNLSDWKLVIVGDDGLKQTNKIQLELLIKNLNAQDKVFLVGKQSNINDFYLRSEIFAFMSSSEGFPNVVGEALSAGLPVVSFDCIAGPSELIDDGLNGFLIPLFDYSEFEQKLFLLATDENLRKKMASSARKSIDKFSSKHIATKYIKMILPNESITN